MPTQIHKGIVSHNILTLQGSVHCICLLLSGSAPDPVFTQTLYEVSVNETYIEGGILPPVDFLTLSCNQSNGTEIMYTLVSDDTIPFTIDLSTGELCATKNLDYETTPEYNFTAVCTDSDDLSLTTMATVIVSLLPVNEFRPRIIPNPMVTVSVEELTPPGLLTDTLPGVKYNVSDMDQPLDNITFTLIEGLYDELYYDEDLNGIVLRESFDRENQSDLTSCSSFPQFQIRVAVCDIYPFVEDCPNVFFLVTFVSTNEHDPEFNETMYSFQIAESAPINTTIATVSCTDQDLCIGGFADMEIIDMNLLDTFSIDSNGNLMNLQPLDYEDVQSYSVNVRCFDSGRGESQREAFTTIELQLVDDNDNSPICSSNATTVDLQAGTYPLTSVLQLSCVDADQGANSQLTFNIDGELPQMPRGQFTLNQTTGEVKFTGEIRSSDSFNFVVLVSDSGPTPLTTRVVVMVNVTGDKIPSLIIIVILCVVGGILLICLLLAFLFCCCYCCCYGHHRKKSTKTRRADSL